ASYTQRFQELALLWGRMFSEESDKVKKYVEGLPDMIHGSDYSVSRLAEIFQQEIVRLHGTPSAIVSDRDPHFASRFWKGLQKAWGTRLKFSTAFHPQTDGQSERTIQTLEDMLRSCALEWTGNWDNYICLVEFAYNNSWCKTHMKNTINLKIFFYKYELMTKQAPPSPDYIPGPEHADDEIVAEDQPYAEDASPIAQSPEYVPESDFEMHPEDDDDEDPEEDPVDYPAHGGDDGDDEEESSEDEEDDEMDVEADEEEEEHPAPADSVVVAPTAADQAPSAEETEPFETDESTATPPPHPAYRTTARISIPAPVPMPAWTDSEVVRLLAISCPPASPLSPWYEGEESSFAAAARPTGGFRADYGFVATVDRETMRDPERE
nr:Gag protease polyprotein [Tanacetum cinerariifolium]